MASPQVFSEVGCLGAPPPLVQRMYQHTHRQSLRWGTVIGLMRVMAVPAVADALYRSGGFLKIPGVRIAQTRAMIKTLVIHGLDSSQGRQAIEKMNRAHQGVNATSADFCFVLGRFFIDPIAWNTAYSSRKFTGVEKHTLFDFWRSVGERLGVADMPESLADWCAFDSRYQQSRLAQNKKGTILALKCLQALASDSMISVGQRVRRAAILAMIGEPLCKQLGLQLPHKAFVVSLQIWQKIIALWNRSIKPNNIDEVLGVSEQGENLSEIRK